MSGKSWRQIWQLMRSTTANSMCLLFIAALIGVSISAPAYAAPGDIFYVQRDIANVRETPDENGWVVMRVPSGRKLTELRRHGEWINVRINRTLGFEGWIHNSVIAATAVSNKPEISEASSKGVQQVTEFGDTHSTDEFILRLTGSPALQTSVECRMKDNSGQYRISFEPNGIPKRYSLSGNALSCLVRRTDLNRGRLAVSLTRKGEVIASGFTTVPLSSIRLRSDGPWGKAKIQTFGNYLKFSKPAPNTPRDNPRMERLRIQKN